MKLIKLSQIDGETDWFEFHTSRQIPGFADGLRLLFDEWMRARADKKICACFPKHFSIETTSNGDFVSVLAGWNCKRCLPLLEQLVAERFPDVCRVIVGTDRSDFPPTEQRLIHFANAVAHFENGVSISAPPFDIYRAPVTTGEFDAFTRATGYVTTAERLGDGSFRMDCTLEPLRPQDRKHVPVHNVSFDDAEAYCEWAKVRLPTEVELLAAALVDQRILTRPESKSFLYGRDGRFDFERFPDALASLNIEIVNGAAPPGLAVVRRGPFYVRTSGWESVPNNRFVVARHDYDLMTGFRVCAK